MKVKKSHGEIVFDSFNCIFMILFSITILFPFWNTIVASFGSAQMSVISRVNIWPDTWSFDAYTFVFTSTSIPNAYLVTIIRVFTATVIHIIVCMCIAYPLSKSKLPFRNFFSILVLIPMFFQGGIIPFYILMRNLHLNNTFWILVLPLAFESFVVILMRNYFKSLDPGVEESAYVDGASYLTILFRIVLPLSKPLIATIALWHIVAIWNDWYFCLVYINDEKLFVLQYVLRRMIDNSRQMSEKAFQFAMDNQKNKLNVINIQSAATIVTILPIVFTYPFLQKYFVKGIMLGSLKG